MGYFAVPAGQTPTVHKFATPVKAKAVKQPMGKSGAHPTYNRGGARGAPEPRRGGPGLGAAARVAKYGADNPAQDAPGPLQGPVMVAPPLIENNPPKALNAGPQKLRLGTGTRPLGSIENTGHLPMGLNAGPRTGSPGNARVVGMPKAINQSNRFPNAINTASSDITGAQPLLPGIHNNPMGETPAYRPSGGFGRNVSRLNNRPQAEM